MAKRRRSSKRRKSLSACRTYRIKGHSVRLKRNKKGQFKACKG